MEAKKTKYIKIQGQMIENTMGKNKVGTKDQELPKHFKYIGCLRPFQEDLEEVMQNAGQRDGKYGREV